MLATILVATVNGCRTPSPLSIEIASPSSGATMRTNLVLVTGTVTDSHSTLTVNGEQARVNQDGTFSRYVELQPGENAIAAVASLGDRSVHRSIDIFFEPAVAIHLYPPDIEQFRGASGPTKIAVRGYVFPAGASVAVNGNVVQVNGDGSFQDTIVLTVSQGSNVLKASATLDGEEDTWAYTIIMKDGIPTIPPGQGLAYGSRVDLPRSATVETGGSARLFFTADIRNDLEEIPSRLVTTATPVDAQYSNDNDLVADGLDVLAKPETLSIYPNTVYQLEIAVTTQSTLHPGTYWIMVHTVLGNEVSTSGWIKLEVTDPG